MRLSSVLLSVNEDRWGEEMMNGSVSPDLVLDCCGTMGKLKDVRFPCPSLPTLHMESSWGVVSYRVSQLWLDAGGKGRDAPR